MRGLFLWREHAPRKLAEHELRRLEHPANESSRPLLSGGMEHERAQSVNLRRTGSDQMVQKSISRLGLVVSDVQPLPTRRAQHICFPCQIIPTHPSRDGFTGAASQCLGAVLDTLLNGEAMETELGANR